ncbi:MAG: AIPR family protein [Planctomycetia bacterium]|nr:AIPR family protein [Planctomycetia bacterium]
MNQKFLDWILQEVFDRAHHPEIGSIRLPALTGVLLDSLEEAGILAGPQPSYFRFERGNVAAEVHAYACDTEDDVISLFFCVDATADIPLGQPAEPCNTGKDVLDRAFRRMEAFIKLAQSERTAEIEESQPARELVDLIKDAPRQKATIELNVVTTGLVSDRASGSREAGSYRREIWDLLRLERVCGGNRDGSITIDFTQDFGTTLPCLVTPKSSDGLQVLLTCIPGQLLADIYNTHRAGLLERNVRSFLQFTGKVNKGIRDTVLNEPHRFLPYNNGLSATAGEVEFQVLSGSLAQIRIVKDFQIVNGGQTTASIASCARRDDADLQNVSVPMKLTVVPRSMLDGLVPKISRYANTQNRIQDSDFSANDPWHIGLERLSRNTWTRATPENPRGTRWFFERSRGQYADGLAANATPAGKRQYRSENPPGQRFTKTDLAKFVLSWDQYPTVVSRGAQKCFMTFMQHLSSSQRKTPEEVDFKRIVALGILFRFAERLYGEMDYQGYRAQVVTYSIARLSHECQRQLDVEAIWKEQQIPADIQGALKYIVTGVREMITEPPKTQKNVGEWCKRDECWTAVLARSIKVTLKTVPTGKRDEKYGSKVDIAPALHPDQQEFLDVIRTVPAVVWFSVSSWAKETSTLQPWQRGLAYSLGDLTERSKVPSMKQAVHGRKIVLEALRLGFTHDAIDQRLAASIADLSDSVTP